MKKLFISLLVVGISFFSYTFATQNLIILESDYSNFKNDRIVLGHDNNFNFPDTYLALGSYFHSISFVSNISVKYPVFKLTDVPTQYGPPLTPFNYYYSGTYITGTDTSFEGFYQGDYSAWSKAALSTGYGGDFFNNFGLVFDPASYSIGFKGPSFLNGRSYSHAWDLNNFPNSLIDNFKNSPPMVSSAQDVGTIRAIGYLNANIYNSSLLPFFDPALVQYFNSDSVETYANGLQFVNASMGANNSQYFLGNGNSWSWVTPNLSVDGYGKREDLFFGTVEHQDNFSQFGFGGNLPSSRGILIISVNGYSVNRNNYKNTVLAISKDPQDPRNLLAAIYPNCNCTSIDCLANYCTPSKIGHLIGKIDTNPTLGSYTCSSTGISTLLPYNAGGAGGLGTYGTVNLNTVENYYGGNYIDDSACNPIPRLFYQYFYQEYAIKYELKHVVADIIVNGDYICFNANGNSLSANCVQIVSSTSVSPIAGASSQYSGMDLLGGYPETYDLYSGGSTAGYVMQVVSQIENTYGYTQQDCNTGQVIYTGTNGGYAGCTLHSLEQSICEYNAGTYLGGDDCYFPAGNIAIPNETSCLEYSDFPYYSEIIPSFTSWSLLPYYSGRDLATQRLWVYCHYSDQLILGGYPEALTGNEGNINDLLYGSGVNAGTIFNCPNNYQATTNISLKISNFPGLSILNGTTLGNIDLIKPVACMIGAFNYGFDNVGISSNQSGMLSNFQNLNTNKVFGISLGNTNRVDIGGFTHILGLLLVAPALYLAFKRLI